MIELIAIFLMIFLLVFALTTLGYLAGKDKGEQNARKQIFDIRMRQT